MKELSPLTVIDDKPFSMVCKCSCCKEEKECLMEMIGPSTTMTCEECQKIPPAYRNRK